MAWYEIATARWPGAESYAQRAVELAGWMIRSHRVLERQRNTAYAFEGLACAWHLARLTGDDAARDLIGQTIDTGLARLISWQVGSPTASDYIRLNAQNDPLAVGGCLNGATDPRLRVDVTQHQMHATLLARRLVYVPEQLSADL